AVGGCMSESSRLITLTQGELESLLERAAERAAMRVLAGNNHNGNHNGHADNWLTPEQAAEKLNVTILWIYRHARRWQFVQRLSLKQLLISDVGLPRCMSARKKLEAPLRWAIDELYNSSMKSTKKGRKRPMKDKVLKVRTVVMPDDLWDELRVKSIYEKRSASDIIRELVSDYLKKGGKRR